KVSRPERNTEREVVDSSSLTIIRLTRPGAGTPVFTMIVIQVVVRPNTVHIQSSRSKDTWTAANITCYVCNDCPLSSSLNENRTQSGCTRCVDGVMFWKISVMTVLLLVATTYITAVHSVKCYVCNNCGNTLNRNSWSDNCNACMKYKVNDFVNRSCVKDCNYTVYMEENFEDLCCRSDYCNKTDRLLPTFALWSLFAIYALLW
ncbi:hypothetical protein EG68_00479, partial [Paragonimus skrjabini miyazakii]